MKTRLFINSKTMKCIIFLLSSLIILTNISAQTLSYVDSSGETQLWGTVKPSDINKDHYKQWFDESYNDHQVQFTKDDRLLFEGVTVKIFIATWCGDTKYLFPRFMKLWDYLELPYDNLEITSVHSEGTDYKQGPNKETIGYNIHKVPTFIFMKEGSELGRIVERTIFDLETDVLQILREQPYAHRYQSVRIINEFLNSTEQDSLASKNIINEAQKKVRRELSSVNDLNVFAHILKYQKKLEQAHFVFKLNELLFPYDPSAKRGLGSILMDLGQYTAAKEKFYEAIRLKEEDDRAAKKIIELNDLIKKTSVVKS